MLENEEYIRLIARHLTGEANPPSEKMLLEWLEGDPERNRIFEEFRLIWQSRLPFPAFDSVAAFERLKKQVSATRGL
jgi:hypothetical protein